MKKPITSCLALLTIFSSLSFAQVKYDSNGDFGIGTSSPSTLLHLKTDDPVLYMESAGEHDNTIRLGEGSGSWLGAFITYDGGVNRLYIGTHISSGTNLSDDRNVLTMHRSSGQIELTPISTAYNFQSFVTKAPNYETQCYNVKLGSSNNFWVDGDGDVWHSGLHTISDRSLKENVEEITNSLEMLKLLRPVKYNFVRGAFGADESVNMLEYGLIAQEVEEIIPDIVSTRNDSLKTISYLELIPLLIEAVQAQQSEISTLQDQVASLSGDIRKSASSQTTENSLTKLPESILFQNVPNPFNEGTIIKYSIPVIESYAMVNVYDLKGSQVKSYNISQTGDGKIMIPASDLSPGLFIYNLIVDGFEVSSLRMVLTD